MKNESIGIDNPRVKEIMKLQEFNRLRKREKSRRLRGFKDSFVYPIIPESELRKLKTVIQDGMWQGRRCFIIGGGPSLKGFRYSKLKNELTIGINRAYEKLIPSIIFGADRQFFQWANEGKYGEAALRKWQNTKTPKIRLYIEGTGNLPGFEDILSIQCCGLNGLGHSINEGMAYGGNSGYAALNLAIILGANPIYLLGFDMHPAGGFWHNGHPGKQGDITNFIHEFKYAKNEILQRARVINLNRNSNLKCFEFGDFPTGKEKLIEQKSITAIQNPIIDARIQQREKIIKNIRYDSKWILISFFTIDTPYEEKIKELESTIKDKKVNYCFFGKLSLGDWRKNLNHKSEVILRALDMFPDNDIVFVDSDAKVNKYPILFNELSNGNQSHVAACFHEYKESTPGGSLLSGTLWIKNIDISRQLIKRWHEIGLKNEKIRHQHCLRLAIDEFHMAGKLLFVYRLPIAYTYIFDYHYNKKISPVITHYQASRKFRNIVGQSIMLRDSNFTAVSGSYVK